MRREGGGEFVETLLEQELGPSRLSPQDRSLCQELAYGAVRWEKTLDWLIARKTYGKPQRPGLQVLLRLGLYQLFWLDRVPDHAAVHETVELAKKRGFIGQAGFINAVLRGYVREKETTRQLLDQLKQTEPATGFSHPDWLVARWTERWGADRAARLLDWNNTPPPTFARRNALKADAATLVKRWADEGVQFTPRAFDWVENELVFQLDALPGPLAALKSFKDGLFYIQDPSTLLAVSLLDPRPDQTLLDLCAAPGGKSTFIAQIIQNRGTVIAQDSQAARLELIRQNTVRLGVTCVETSLAPDTVIPNPTRRFDRILVDAPCSNTGVLRRRLDLRWRLRPEEIKRLRDTQLQILRQAAPRLQPGGVLVYSTCSLEPEENRSVVEAFLSEHPAFALETDRELIPFTDGVDGAYVARLRQNKNVD